MTSDRYSVNITQQGNSAPAVRWTALNTDACEKLLQQQKLTPTLKHCTQHQNSFPFDHLHECCHFKRFKLQQFNSLYICRPTVSIRHLKCNYSP